MLLSDCIQSCLDDRYPVFQDTKTIKELQAAMRAGGYNCVPVCHKGKFSGMALQNELELVVEAPGKKLRDLTFPVSPTAASNEHLLALFSRMEFFPETIIPVIDPETGEYLGVVHKERLFMKMAEVFHLVGDAMTLELEVPAFGLTVSEVIAVLEKNDATVLSFGSYHPSPEGESRVLILRLQVHDGYHLVKTLEQYGYMIRYAAPLSGGNDDNLREKALEFIRVMDL
ncbi:MAG: CBS domain-containing protein [Candidatus Chlorobium antarcticum]|jgi:acetoin utilization protein AcuB|nr:CBS domain-containing protein [Candidatus Chlorobium antarcticum]